MYYNYISTLFLYGNLVNTKRIENNVRFVFCNIVYQVAHCLNTLLRGQRIQILILGCSLPLE